VSVASLGWFEQRALTVMKLLRKSFGGVAVLLGEYLLNAVFTICVQAELTTQRVLSAAGWKR
jgi:hypothetical protein